MSKRKNCIFFGAFLFVAAQTDVTRADVLEFDDKGAWIDATGGDFTTIDFTGFPSGTVITNQYIDLGLIFDSGDPNYIQGPLNGYVNDDWGLDGRDEVIIEFAQPIQWFGMDFPGNLHIQLIRDGEVGEPIYFGAGGVGNFGGVIADQPFDGVRIHDYGGFENTNLDDIFFGPPIPGPGAHAALAITGLARAQRKPRQLHARS